MKTLFKVPLEQKDLNEYLKSEKNFLKGILADLEQVRPLENKEEKNPKSEQTKAITELLEFLGPIVDKIYPSANPENQVRTLLAITNHFSKLFLTTKISELLPGNYWVLLDEGYLGKIVEEDYELAILLYLVALVYHFRAKAFVQNSPEYRYFNLCALSAIKGAQEFTNNLEIKADSHMEIFVKALELRKLEIEAEITKSDAFIARKQGDFDRAAKLFAGAASYRFSMMNFDLPPGSDNQVKIFASTELGMACFYIAVGLSNSKDVEQAYLYLLKAKSYFENTVKLSENNTELLESANKRLDLVNPYIDRIKDSIEGEITTVEQIPDPQPLMLHVEPEALIIPDEILEKEPIICSNCMKRVEWTTKCPECKGSIIPITR